MAVDLMDSSSSSSSMTSPSRGHDVNQNHTDYDLHFGRMENANFPRRQSINGSQDNAMIDGFGRHLPSTDWLVNNLTSRNKPDVVHINGASADEVGTCSGVVWVESVDPNLGVLVEDSGQNSELQATNSNKNRSRTRPISNYEEVMSHSKSFEENSHRVPIFSFLKSSAASNTTATSNSRNKCVVSPGGFQEPIHMTLEEVRFSLSTADPRERDSTGIVVDFGRENKLRRSISDRTTTSCSAMDFMTVDHHHHKKLLPKSLKHTLRHWLGLGKGVHVDTNTTSTVSVPVVSSNTSSTSSSTDDCYNAAQRSEVNDHFVNRALPPLPSTVVTEKCRMGGYESSTDEDRDCSDTEDKVVDLALPWWNRISVKSTADFASSIQKVKDYGWYWGPISGIGAETMLANEPDGSFIVRDSSDEHYIFSLTFKLDGLVRHVRIEHDHGNFSFGTFTKFKSNTIVEFIENAVQHSRSGRYLFFLHRRPVLGPMRVQLLHPVSRFKQVQSLQHMCRFVIVKVVRRDLIDCLPLPNRLKLYLNTPQYYSEEQSTFGDEVSRDRETDNGSMTNDTDMTATIQH